MKYSIYSFFLFIAITNTAFAQCFDADATIWQNTWASCEMSQNPKNEYGNSHWIQYNFGAVRKLSKSWVWNTNDPAKLNQGFNLVKIDYSIDGQNWTYFGEMNFPKAAGEAVYGGFAGPDLVGIEAQYVLLTAMSNHGDANCSGLAEIKFNLLPDGTTGTPPTGGGGDDCGEFEELVVEEIYGTEVYLYWEYTEDTEGFLLEYRPEGGAWIQYETEESEAFLTDLEPETEYEFRVSTECGDELIISEMDYFFTEENMDDCFAVEEIWLEEVNETEAFFVWEGPEDAEIYYVEYGLTDGSQWEVTMTYEPEIFLEDLTPFSEYFFAVGVECDGKIMESEPYEFFTIDGPIDLSDTNEINAEKIRYQLFPNPTKGQLKFHLMSEQADILNYSIRAVDGQVILRNVRSLVAGRNEVSVDLTSLPDGVYFLEALMLKDRTQIGEKIVKMQ